MSCGLDNKDLFWTAVTWIVVVAVVGVIVQFFR
jgi:cytochrome b subunit of formate dehydrogenase